MKIVFSGGKHIRQSNEKEKRRIHDRIGEIDVVLREGRDEPDDDMLKLMNFLAAPLLMFSFPIWYLFLRLASIPGASDRVMANELAEEHNAEFVKIDRSIHSLVSETRSLWLIAHVAILVFPIIVFSRGVLWGAILLLLVCTVGLFVAFIAGSFSTRNMAMAMHIERIAQSEDYETALVVIGGEHEEPIKELLRNGRSEIEIIE